MKYVSPIKLPPEVAAEIALAPEWGTPEHAVWLNKLREQAFSKGLRRDISTDEVLYALERDRAGYDGLGELWRSTSSILTQAVFQNSAGNIADNIALRKAVTSE